VCADLEFHLHDDRGLFSHLEPRDVLGEASEGGAPVAPTVEHAQQRKRQLADGVAVVDEFVQRSVVAVVEAEAEQLVDELHDAADKPIHLHLRYNRPRVLPDQVEQQHLELCWSQPVAGSALRNVV
jgi:hypothetical protein